MASDSESLPPPGLPAPRPCLSIWQRSTRYSTLLNEGANAELPSTADVVVIGSGMSGALTVYELLSSPDGPKNVVMLEAREACSGATGRNAGHCRPDAFRGFAAFSKRIDPEQAMKIIKHEKLVLQLVKAFIDKHGVDCDFDYCRTYDVVMGEDFLQYVTDSFNAYKEAGGDMSDIVWLDAEAAKKATRVPAALGAYEWTAASLHPAKLCQAILAMSLALGMSLFTHTPAVSVTRSGNANNDWVVETPRGSITTPIVVHGTNAFAATLLPCLQSQVRPVRAQAHKVIPTPAYTGPKMLTHTYSLRFTLYHFYSVIQRKADGALVLGTSRGVPGMGQEIFETKDDSTHNKLIEEDCLKNLKQVFSDWGEEVQGEGHEFGWTGILGLTKDAMPFIGPVPSLPGQFVIAGFNGHGMARIFGSAPGLAKIILGGNWRDTTMPECFQITEQRLERLSALP
ncbi:FAD dependent oxidoreductase [Mycena sp. CBHHK59/15]|nr:FAD dependent oxidoreductase [Mycena sp. CBHHK59/15]